MARATAASWKTGTRTSGVRRLPTARCGGRFPASGEERSATCRKANSVPNGRERALRENRDVRVAENLEKLIGDYHLLSRLERTANVWKPNSGLQLRTVVPSPTGRGHFK
jgi:hypothetical protein